MDVRKPVSLHLGCGASRQEGWINCDILPGPTVDEVFDVEDKWPFADASIDHIYSSHLLEHLRNFRVFFKEAWRVLRPNGGMACRLPFGGHRSAMGDVDHVRPWYPETFCFLQPGYGEAIGNLQHCGWAAPFSIAQADLRLSRAMAPLVRSHWRRKLSVPWLAWLPDFCEEIIVYLNALKTETAVRTFRQVRDSRQVPTRYTACLHHLEGRALYPGETLTYIPVAESEAIAGMLA